MSTEATPKTLIVTLTDRPPVRIREDDWPVIASASDDSWAGHRGDGRYAQALSRGELDRWMLEVRQHADGRVLVYGVFDAARFTTAPRADWRGGELLDDASEIPVAIRFVGHDGDFPVHLVDQCIADLPPQEL